MNCRQHYVVPAVLVLLSVAPVLLLVGCGEPPYVRQLREHDAEYQSRIEQLSARVESLEAEVSQLKTPPAPPAPPAPVNEKPVVAEKRPVTETPAKPPSAPVKANVQKAEPASPTLYITRTGKKYHRGSCRYLRQNKIAISLSDAKRRGYTPCKVCRPPG